MFPGQKRGGFDPTRVVRTSPAKWKQPEKWNEQAAREGRRFRVFTSSWTDFFHADADPWRAEAWHIIRETPNLDYQILTKRPGRIAYNLPPDWGEGYPNVWLGVSIESKDYLWRIDTLRKISARVRFLSLEPLLEDLGTLNLSGVDWVIVGGESGPGFRPMHLAWAHAILDQCRKAGIPFFFKQRSAFRPGTGDTLDIDGVATRFHQFPEPEPPAAA
jgi:protein gp37